MVELLTWQATQAASRRPQGEKWTPISLHSTASLIVSTAASSGFGCACRLARCGWFTAPRRTLESSVGGGGGGGMVTTGAA